VKKADAAIDEWMKERPRTLMKASIRVEDVYFGRILFWWAFGATSSWFFSTAWRRA
jgi:hypothetical protein